MRPIRKALPTFSKILAGNLSNFSSVREIEIKRPIAEQLFEDVTTHYDNPNHTPKPINKKLATKWSQHLEKIIKKEDPELSRTLEAAKVEKNAVVLLSGIIQPEILPLEVPKTNEELQGNKSLQKKLMSTEAIFSAYALSLGLNPDPCTDGSLVGYIFASPSSSNLSQISGNLRWHNDGWQTGDPVEKILLMGMFNNNSGTRTELLTFDQISDQFKKNGKGDLLQALNEYCYIENPFDEVQVFQQAKILDQKTGKINFSCQGIFSSKNPKFQEAILYLNESFDAIKPLISIEISPGQIVAIDNLSTVHQKKVEEADPSKEVMPIFQKRLIGRMTGDAPPQSK